MNSVPVNVPSTGPQKSVGPFRLIERLPGAREAFLAKQLGPVGFERFIEVKFAKRDAADERAAEALGREAKVMACLDHPNIVRFHDFIELDNRVILVLERFSGLSLARFLELMSEGGHVLDERITWHIALALFGALSHAHGALDTSGNPSPVIHRDVRPAHVLISSDGRVRLTGFSSAQQADTKEESTAFGELVGVPSYVAPEQVRGQENTERSDAFSAALIIWEMLLRQSATPEGLSDFDLLKHLSERRVESLRVGRPDIPALVTTALDMCLATNPEERRIHCEEVAGCIQAGLDVGDGALAIREAIVELGPAVQILAGATSNTSSSRPKMVSSPPLPHRGESFILSKPARVPTRVEAAVTAVPRAPGIRPILPATPPRSEPSLPSFVENNVAALQEDVLIEELPQTIEITLPKREIQDTLPIISEAASLSPASVSQQSTVPTSELSSASSDDEFLALRLAQKRRQYVRMAVVGIPVLGTLVAVSMALSGGLGGTGDTPVPIAPTAEEKPRDMPEQPSIEVENSEALPFKAPGAKEAVVVVKGPPTGFVYISGRAIGPTDSPIVTECGQRFLRVGTEMGAKGMTSVQWLADGQSVWLSCGTTTTVEARAK